MKFDSREKKPNIYLAALAALIALLLFLIGAALEAPWLAHGNLILAVTFGVMVFCLLDAFLKQLQYNPYSYNTILYAGFALFLLSLFGTYTVAALTARGQTAGFPADVLYPLLHSAKNYMLLTSPFLVLFSVALFVSNMALIRHEGRRFVNVLGMLLALCLLAGEALVGYLDLRSAISARAVLLQNMAVNLIAAMYLYFECMIVGAMVADLIAARYVPEKDKDYLVVLGCGLKKDGSPTPLLKGRLDLALDFDKKQREAGGKEARFLVSGGQGPDEVRPEAHAMRDYLLEQGIAPERIDVEDRSTDTAENMRFSRDIIHASDPAAKVAFFTTNYHVFRAGLKARRVKMRAVGMGAKTRWYFWPNAAVREFVGLLTEHRGKQAFVILILLAVYAALTVLAFA